MSNATMPGRLVIPLILVLLLSFIVSTTSAQSADLAALLPEPDAIAPEVVTTESGTRSLAEVAGSFADPGQAEDRLRTWGWEENAFRGYANRDPDQAPLRTLQISLHQFRSADGATDALSYFLEARAQALGQREVDVPDPTGDETRAISGESDGATESTGNAVEATAYIRVNNVLARITAVSTSPDPVAYAVQQGRLVVDAALGPGHYVSPDFGFVIDWRPSVWTRDDRAGNPDQLELIHGNEYLIYRGAPIAAMPAPGSEAWHDVLADQVAQLALERARDHGPATIMLNGMHASVAFDRNGEATTEDLTAVPLPSGAGAVLTVHGGPEGAEMAGPLPPGILVEDWAASADGLPQPPAPGGLNAIPAARLSFATLVEDVPESFDDLTRRPGQSSGGSYWPLSIEHVAFAYGDATDLDRDPSAWVAIDRLPPDMTASGAIRQILNLRLPSGVFPVAFDVSPDASTPYLIDSQGNLIWSTQGSDWILTFTGQDEAEREAFARALVDAPAVRPGKPRTERRR